jgi:1,2-diacylglycerol 3-alpha-glucosyltransferase
VSVAILTQQISPYHAARYRAASAYHKINILSFTNDADFAEFLCDDLRGLNAIKVYSDKKQYLDAVGWGTVWSETSHVLHSLSPRVVAIAGWSFPESLSAIAWAQRQGAGIVLMSASQRNDAPRSHLREAIKSRIVTSCDAALVGGSRQADYVTGLGMPQDRVFQGYDAIDNRHFAAGAERARSNASEVRRHYGLPKRYLLASGRFVPKKNLEALIVAFAKALRQINTDHTLVILGDGIGRPAMQELISASSLSDRVLLAGFISYSDLPNYYGLADAFVHVPLTEQWGLVVNEAAASGLPLVISRPCGASAELVQDGVNGFLVDPTDIADIARRLCAVMGASDEQLKTMGKKSQQVVADWDLERFAGGLSDAVNVALGCQRRSLVPLDVIVMRALSRHYFASIA